MGFISFIKILVIKATDVVNQLNDPFDQFSRPALPKENKRLYELEKEFFDDLMDHFWVCGGKVLASRLPIGWSIDLGDQAIWHGIYTAILCMRYKVTQEGADKIANAAQGLKLHQTVHGESKPRLVRGVSDDKKTWQDDASNDSATGHLFGIYAVWKWGPETLRSMCAELILGLASELLDHDHALVGPDGKPTTYGALEQGWKTDPLRISLALAIYGVAYTITNRQEFKTAFTGLYAKYGTLACYPKARLWWLDNQNDTHRAAIHLAILSDITAGDFQAGYKNGLIRLWNMVEKDGNIWVNALCAWGGGTIWRADMAVKVLSEFTLKDQQFNDGKENYPIPMPYSAIGIRAVKWGDTFRSSQPLPRYAVRSQDFAWQRNLHSIDVGSKGAPADSRLNGGAFLAAYWLSRLVGVITGKD